MQLLTKACEPPGCGHGPVSEALSTLRLRFGEPVRFRFLVGMLSSAGGCLDLQAAGIRFLNTLIETAPSTQSKLYLQAEFEQAGFSIGNIKKVSNMMHALLHGLFRCKAIPLLTNFSAVFWTRLTSMDSANECFSGCAR